MRIHPYALSLVAASVAAVGIAGMPHGGHVALRAVTTAAVDDCTHAAASQSSSKASGGALAVSIPPLTLVRVDAQSMPTAVMTNTGRHPCAGDTFYALAAGKARPASAALVRTVLALRFAGDWSRAGAWHAV